MGYVGRFAPSPTGPLHAGSLVAALASWLDAQAHGGRWLVRIEDIDPPRCPAGADRHILRQLEQCQLHADEPPQWQSQRDGVYAAALAQLQVAGWAYPCSCTRRDIEAAQAALGLATERHVERPYPGTCRNGLYGKAPRAWRFHTQRFQDFWQQVHKTHGQTAPFFIADGRLHWLDRRLGAQAQNVAATAGDFVVCRADGLWAYQLAVVTDDAAQGITDVVRGADLADNTPRQILLQTALGLPVPRYMHTPLVLQADGEKLSKQHGAPPVATDTPEQALAALRQAAAFLDLHSAAETISAALPDWTAQWASQNYNSA